MSSNRAMTGDSRPCGTWQSWLGGKLSKNVLNAAWPAERAGAVGPVRRPRAVLEVVDQFGGPTLSSGL
jgi:hypothetical protein